MNKIPKFILKKEKGENVQNINSIFFELSEEIYSEIEG
jgi:hypothetical protein